MVAALATVRVVAALATVRVVAALATVRVVAALATVRGVGAWVAQLGPEWHVAGVAGIAIATAIRGARR